MYLYFSISDSTCTLLKYFDQINLRHVDLILSASSRKMIFRILQSHWKRNLKQTDKYAAFIGTISNRISLMDAFAMVHSIAKDSLFIVDTTGCMCRKRSESGTQHWNDFINSRFSCQICTAQHLNWKVKTKFHYRYLPSIQLFP